MWKLEKHLAVLSEFEVRDFPDVADVLEVGAVVEGERDEVGVADDVPGVSGDDHFDAALEVFFFGAHAAVDLLHLGGEQEDGVAADDRCFCVSCGYCRD